MNDHMIIASRLKQWQKNIFIPGKLKVSKKYVYLYDLPDKYTALLSRVNFYKIKKRLLLNSKLGSKIIFVKIIDDQGRI